MAEEAKPTARLKEAIQQESLHFEQFYFWLEKSMPRIFFNEVSIEWITLIVHTLVGFKEQEYFSEIHLKNGAISLCIDTPEADVRILKSFPLYGIKNYTTYISRDPLPFAEVTGYLRIAVLNFTEAFEKDNETLPAQMIDELKQILDARHPEWGGEKIALLIEGMDTSFLRKLPFNLQILALEMFERAQTKDLCQFEIQYDENWEANGTPSMSLVLAWKNVPKHHFLYRLAHMVLHHGLVMKRVCAAYINPYHVSSIFMLSLSLHGAKGEAAWEAADIADFLQEVVMVKYFGSQELIESTFIQTHLLTGNLGNFLKTCMNFIHQVLVHADPNLYAMENIEEALCRHPELTMKMCEAFAFKFHPRQFDLVKFEARRAEFIQLVSQLDTGHDVLDMRRKNILMQGMNFIEHTLKTNFYQNNKSAFAFRLDPSYLDNAPFERRKIFPELPYAIFFVKGMHFIAFHIRFKDLSRGGLRTVYPKRKERVLAEWNTIFTECYNLAFTQHKKNKDIPEGGAKAIIFLKPYERLSSEADILTHELKDAPLSNEEKKGAIAHFIAEQEVEYLYQTQRSFIDNLLTLVNCNPNGELRALNIVDYWKKPEYIYLGPDENLHDSMIEWIAQESRMVGYQPGSAFISGKPRIGINHKEYGVTSLTVNICMEAMLRHLHIDPLKETFTVKMTGGPDGDVAGNQILNLHKYYAHTAKLLALTDVSGTIYDPLGLDLEICAKMFYECKSIRHYPADKISVGGFLLDRETKREPSAYSQQTLCLRNVEGTIEADWISGNEMNALYRQNVHQVQADLFIPCGGRPRTLQEKNYRDFYNKSNEATSKGIIEGANLYLTPWARDKLEDSGVLIIKDSSANKGGVICSSFEILCGLCLTDEEFLENKELLTQEILLRIKQYALNEAQLLLTEHQKTKTHLTELSDELSKKINYFTDQLLDYFDTMTLPCNPKDPLIQCFLHYSLPTLLQKFRDRLLHDIPENHKKAIIASHIGAQLVYQRGLDWYPNLVDILPILLQDFFPTP